uniref:Uncharacterized protein n=1 Tax=Chromera velia CCMP2878 TaxID=1169474 RepID=A0A0G4H2B2_9ALVE|eukprot:Cvel_24382.t1-p1 / transcript=Cvel_24382.t1 / gene=Cvel_24382 / organism=Chromera_velia_CCMP2878 / gene_product=hypothetical protein / transcript_product=hypothetical protein / location=Cvel_scaffold2628:9040-10866(+) / protein_length=609 / sequence_SO=supercontig / SO=protein_coding / is_pseudo=false
MRPLSLPLVLWIFDLPEAPQTEAVLRASAAAAADPELFDKLAASVPVCAVDPLQEGGEWSEHEIRCASNLLALCDGALSGGKLGTFRWSMDRIPRGERATAVCVSGGVHFFTTWNKKALKKGFWEVRRAVIEVMKRHAAAKVITLGFQVPSEALPSLSRFPRTELEAADLTVCMGGRNDCHLRDGPAFQLWLSCLKGDLEAVTEFLSSNALPSLEGHSLSIPPEEKEGVDAGVLGAALMEAAAAGGHSELVKRVFEKIEKHFDRESQKHAAMANILKLRSSTVLTAVAEQGDFELLEWLCEHPAGLIHGGPSPLMEAIRESSDRVGLLKLLDSRGLSEKWGMNLGRVLENAVLGYSRKADLAFLEFLDSRRTSDPKPVFCSSHMYQITRQAHNWDALRFLMTRDPPCPFYSNDPFHQLPPELRDLVFELVRTVGECPWADLPTVPENLEAPLREHIRSTCAAVTLEEVMFPVSIFGDVEVSILHPASWLPPKVSPHFKVFKWIVEKGGEEVSASMVESFKTIRQTGNADESGRVVDTIMQAFYFNTQIRPPFPWGRPIINLLRHRGFEKEKREREFYRETFLDVQSWCKTHGIELNKWNKQLKQIEDRI